MLKSGVTIPEAWSPDGKFLTFSFFGPDVKTASPALGDSFALPMLGDRKPIPLVQGTFTEMSPRVAPDGNWFTYMSNESGRPEIYVQSFPPSGPKWQISRNGGSEPRWRQDGKELFFLAADAKLMAVAVKTERTFEPGTPVEVFQTQAATYDLTRNHYDVSSDGQRFVVNSSLQGAASTPITVVQNWASGLKK